MIVSIDIMNGSETMVFGNDHHARAGESESPENFNLKSFNNDDLKQVSIQF